MDEFVKNVRFAVRTLIKGRGFALVSILTLGLGIGANTAIFSVISGVLLKPLPYANGERLVLVQQSAPLAGQQDASVSVREYYDYREQARSFDELVEYHQMSFDLLERGEPDRVATGVVSHNFFDVLGIQPLLGRAFVAQDDAPGAEAVLVLSYSYWQSRFAGDPKIVDQIFQMNDRPHRVIGVLPNVPHYPSENDVYMSVSACPFRARAETLQLSRRRAFAALNVFGRLKPGVTREAAAAEVGAICGHFTQANKDTYAPESGFTATASGVREELTKDARPMLLILLGITGLVLLLACANVANLTLARLLRRDRELALRAALGADRATLVRQLLTESTITALAGGVVGLLFAYSTVGLLTAFVARFTVRTGEVAIDLRVLLFTLAVSMLTGLLFGVFPALAAGVDLVDALKQGASGSGQAPSRRRMQNLLSVAQVAVSVVLLIGAGLLLTSFNRLRQVDPGYKTERVLSAELFTNFSRYPDADSQRRLYLPLLERLEATPGVVAAAITNAVPLSTLQPGTLPFQIEGETVGEPARRPSLDARVVSANYFATLGIPLLRGRAFDEQDAAGAPEVTVINQATTRYWNGKDPIGSRISADNGQTWVTVVGIVGDVKQFGLDRASQAQAYVPLRQTRQGLAGRVLVRTAGDPVQAGQWIREAVRALDPQMPIKNVRTLEEIRERYLATPRLTAVLLSVFAALALAVTMAGITGVIATSVAQRTREFGLRMALGAPRDNVLRMVLRQGLRLVAVGLALGLAASFVLARVLTAYLYDTSPTDPATIGVVVLAFAAAGTLASLGPAWRATTVDPMIALRTE